MTEFLLSLIPAGLLCGGVAMLINGFVTKDSANYDMHYLWEDTDFNPDDYHFK